jgi:hypothetical protein
LYQEAIQNDLYPALYAISSWKIFKMVFNLNLLVKYCVSAVFYQNLYPEARFYIPFWPIS